MSDQVLSIQPKVPSKKLKEAIHNVTTDYIKLNDHVAKALEIGTAEGFTAKEIGKLLKIELLEAGFDERHVRRILPHEAKRKYKRYHHGKSDNLSDYQQTVTEEDDAPTGYYQGEANEYDIKAVEQYDRPYLIKVVKYLHDMIEEFHTEVAKWDKEITKKNEEIKKLKEMKK